MKKYLTSGVSMFVTITNYGYRLITNYNIFIIKFKIFLKLY